MPFSPESVAARNARRTKRTATADTPADLVAISARPRRPGPAPATAREGDLTATRDLIFAAAAAAFARDGFDGVGVDAIAHAAGVNKAMLYYHFRNKVGLYRAVVSDMLQAVARAVRAIADGPGTPDEKITAFVETVANLRDERPWFPPLMMREMASGAPHLDNDTLAHMRAVFTAFTSILSAGAEAGAFREVHPVMAYMSIMGPLMMNAMRERAGAGPGRANLPMFAAVDREALVAHVRRTALSMLAKDTTR